MQMQLMILILSKVDVLSTLLTRLIAAGISGTTVVDCEGAMRVLSQADIEPPPTFGARIRADFIFGMGKVAGKFVIILNIDRVLSVDEIALLAASDGADMPPGAPNAND